MLKKLERISYLYDIYGNLLTEKQQKALQLYYFDNYSLGEIAGEYSISRQGVYDLLRRAIESLENMEASMNLYERYSYRKKKLEEALDVIGVANPEKVDFYRLKGIIEELSRENEG